MRKALGDYGAFFAFIGIVLVLIGFFINYFPVPEKYLTGYADNDRDGLPETPVYGFKYVFPFAILGASLFITGFIFVVIGGAMIMRSEKDAKLPTNGHLLGQKYTERMPPPYFWGRV